MHNIFKVNIHFLFFYIHRDQFQENIFFFTMCFGTFYNLKMKYEKTTKSKFVS